MTPREVTRMAKALAAAAVLYPADVDPEENWRTMTTTARSGWRKLARGVLAALGRVKP